MGRIILLFLSFATLAYGAEPLTLDQLAAEPAYLGQTVQVRGFAYDLEPGMWVLASQPGLRSCCLVTGEAERLFLAGTMPSAVNGRVVTVEGRLAKHADKLVLSEVRVVTLPWVSRWWIAGGTVVGGVILASLVQVGKRLRRRSTR